MPVIALNLEINAPVERVFDLARSIDLHVETMRDSGETAIAGKTSGLISLNESVIWRAKHFGITQKLTAKITQYNRPHHFRDSMISGAFARFDHDHFFETAAGKTSMRDVFDYDSPLGIFGRIADFLFLEKYMTNLLTERNLIVKKIAESEEWQKFLVF